MKKEKGAILIEAIIGLTIAVILITGLTTALLSSLSNSTFSRAQTIATGYAQQYMETARSYKDYDYDYISTRANGSNYHWSVDSSNPEQLAETPILLSNPQIFTDPSSNIEFQRSILLSSTNTNCQGTVYVEVNVGWEDSKCGSTAFCHKVTLRSCFSNLNYVPLP